MARLRERFAAWPRDAGADDAGAADDPGTTQSACVQARGKPGRASAEAAAGQDWPGFGLEEPEIEP